MVTVETALMLAHLHRDRDDTKALIADCEEDAARCKDDARWIRRDLRDRPSKHKGRYLEIHIPSGDSAYKPRMIDPALGLAVLRAHLADLEARIFAVNEMIRLELDAPATTTEGDMA